MSDKETGRNLREEVGQIVNDLRNKIDGFVPTVEIKNYPPEMMVTSVTEDVVAATGPLSVQLGTTVNFSDERQGLIFDLQRLDTVGNKAKIQIITLGNSQNIKPGDIIQSNEQMLAIPVGDWSIGQVVDPLGHPLEVEEETGWRKKEAKTTALCPLFHEAPTILERDAVKRPLHTGINAIDLLMPIGRGQRELIIGDQGVGKTAVVEDIILAQKGEDVTCVYVAVGKKMQDIARIIDTLKGSGAIAYTAVVVAPADTSDGLKYIAPYSGMAIAEWFMHQGQDVLIVFDDLSLHAQAYRKVSLSLGFPRGREAYPGDMFSVHSTLLERAAQLKAKDGTHGGSITALPIITTRGDSTALLPTNVISITDGQLYLMQHLANKGIMPAIDTGTSVSRIGSAAQPELIKEISKNLKLVLASFRTLSSFGAESIKDPTSQTSYRQGRLLQEILIQPQHDNISVPFQAIEIFAVMTGFLDSVPIDEVRPYMRELLRSIQRQYPQFVNDLASGRATLNMDKNIKDPNVEVLKQILTSLTDRT